MNTPLRLFVLLCLAAWTGHAAAATTTKSKSKTTTKAPAKSEPAAKPKADTPKTEAQATSEEKPEQPSPAVVSTISIEDLSGFDQYPKQVQSLVQSALALTRLELGYLYGSHEPSKGGMDCSGTVYHTLHFQGLKDVPRQSDEMCQWVEKKTQLHLTATATSFDSDEFADLKPGDLLFWTNTTETKRKLPVTHVMIYLGKLKKTGKRVVFGASDGRSFHGERRSGVSVFDFNLPKAESPSRFHGYGPAPGLVPAPPVETKPVIVAAAKSTEEKTPAVEKPAPKPEAKLETKPAEAKEEVRKAVAIVSEAKPESKTDSATKTTSAKPEEKVEVKKATVANATPKTTTTSKPKTTTTQKKTTTASTTTTKRRTPAPPPKSVLEQKVDQAVTSIRRFFRN